MFCLTVDNDRKDLNNDEMHINNRTTRSLFVFLLLLFACSPSGNITINSREEVPLYIIKPSDEEPFYFELDSAGPLLIPSPLEASLAPFIPWTHSRYISGFLPVLNEGEIEETLFAAVNRGGIIEIENSRGKSLPDQTSEEVSGIFIYYHPGGIMWETYPLSSFFCYTQKPVFLFTGEHFFSDPEQAFPDSPLWALENGIFEEIIIPALSNDVSGDRKTSGVFLGKDDIWYIRKNLLRDENAYFRTIDLSLPGQGVSSAVYLEASSPLEADSPSVPPLITWIMEEAGRLTGKPCIATVVSSEFPMKRLFSSPSIPFAAAHDGSTQADNEFPLELSGYYRPPASNNEALAVLLFPDGRGIYCRSDGNTVKNGHFSLPSLPPAGFVYTGVALLGSSNMFLVASWEEQNEWNIGSAGLLLLEFGF